MFWRLRRYWPNDDRFNVENFSTQPTWLVLQAIEYGAKLNEESYHFQELGISTLSSILVNVNKDSKSKPAKPEDFHYFMREARSLFDSTVCDCFDSIARDRLMPDWVLEFIPPDLIDELIRNRKYNPVRGIRLLKNDSIALFLPEIRGDNVSIPLGVMGEVENGIHELLDVDSGQRWIMNLDMPPEAEGKPQAFVDYTFEIAEDGITDLEDED